MQGGEMELGGGGSFKDIVLEQLRRIAKVSTVEFRGGFYTTVTDREGHARELYVEDTREVFNNSVYVFASILLCKFDDEMKACWEKYKEDIKIMTDEFLKFTKMDDKVVLGEAYYEDKNEKIALETLKQKKLEANRKLLIDLTELLGRHDWLEITGGTY